MLDDEAHQSRGGDANHGGDPEDLSVLDHERVGGRGSEHEDGAVREVENVEDAKDERVTDGE